MVEDDDYKPREDAPEPDDGVTHQTMIKSCLRCVNLTVCLQPGHPPAAGDLLSWLLAHENVVEVRCDAGRIRYNNGREKRYKTKYPLTIEPELDTDCPDFEER